MSCIYILTNKINNKKYVGQTTYNFEDRWKSHIKAAKYKNKSNISKAINKYGIDSFDKYVFKCDEEDLDYLEIELIKILDSTNRGYNIDYGGNKVKYRSEETKKKMSESQKGNTRWLGKRHSESTRKKQSETHKGNKNPMYGIRLNGKKNGRFGKGYLQVGDKNPMYGKRPWNKKD